MADKPLTLVAVTLLGVHIFISFFAIFLFRKQSVTYHHVSKILWIISCLIVLISLCILIFVYGKSYDKNDEASDDAPMVNFHQQNKNLVFTSAGDKTNFVSHWLDRQFHRNFDIWVVYYGDSETDKYKENADHWERRKGSKFQNFYYMWKKYKAHLKKYKKIFVLDDDIIFSTIDINRCFEMSYLHELWLLQPTFKTSSKISHEITKQKPNSVLRYSNFVEVNTSLFDVEILEDIMEKYDPVLIGYGVDLLVSYILTRRKDYHRKKIALLDNVSCVNPHDIYKGGVREVDRVGPSSKRMEIWSKFAQKHKIYFGVKDIKTYDTDENYKPSKN